MGKCFESLGLIGAISVALQLLSSASIQAAEFQYFEKAIDFWGKEKKGEVEVSSKLESKLNQPTEKKEDATNTTKDDFQWKKYMNPASNEFFREGDYTPPEPFMELVRNQTDDNIRMWFAFMERKNELASRLQRRMMEYAKAAGPSVQNEAKENIVQVARRMPTPADDFERFRFRMYFDSQCPHCKRMFETLNDLQDRGYFVEARQVDNGALDHIRSNIAIVAAKSSEVKQYNISVVPLLLIGDLKTKKVYRQSGFMTPEQILTQIHDR